MQIVLNRCFGGFSLSDAAWKRYVEAKGIVDEGQGSYDIPRTDLDLIAIVATMGAESFGKHARLHIVEVPHEFWRIDEYDGIETVYASDSEIRKY